MNDLLLTPPDVGADLFWRTKSNFDDGLTIGYDDKESQ
jgi:hypothetical protein